MTTSYRYIELVLLVIVIALRLTESDVLTALLVLGSWAGRKSEAGLRRSSRE